MRAFHALAAAALVVLSGCTFYLPGDGTETEQRRTVDDFTGVDLGHGVVATVTLGPKSVRMSGEGNILDAIRTVVRDGKLVTEVDSNVTLLPTREVHVEIRTPTLGFVGGFGGAQVTATSAYRSRLEVMASGASTVAVKEVDADALRVVASAASLVTLSGTARTAVFQLSTVRALLKPLVVVDGTLQVSGGTEAEVCVTDELNVEISGRSTVRIWGNPTVKQVDVSGDSSCTLE
ncbi:MAG: DUF2807 domain-containing protein [Myxococcota bacterium]